MSTCGWSSTRGTGLRPGVDSWAGFCWVVRSCNLCLIASNTYSILITGYSRLPCLLFSIAAEEEKGRNKKSKQGKETMERYILRRIRPPPSFSPPSPSSSGGRLLVTILYTRPWSPAGTPGPPPLPARPKTAWLRGPFCVSTHTPSLYPSTAAWSRSTPDEEAVSRLWLAAVAPPTLTRGGLFYLLVEVGPYRRMPRQELAVASGKRLPYAAGRCSSEAPPRRGM